MVVETGRADRLPPHDTNAEEAVIASILVDPDAVLEVLSSNLKAEDFYREQNRWIFEACKDLFDRGETINQITCGHELARRGQLDDAGGNAYLSRIVTYLPTSVGAQHYANIIQADATYRRLISAATQIVRRAHESGASVDDVTAVLSEAEAMIARVRQDGLTRDFVHIKELLAGFLESSQSTDAATAAQARSIRTGFSDLDQLLNGLKRGDLVIVAARPSLGKTSLALNFARNAAVGQSAIVAFFSIEMAAEQLVTRMLSSESGVDSVRLMLGHQNEREEKKVMQSLGVLADLPLFFDDSAMLTMSDMRAKAKRLQQEKGGLDLVLVDYLQLMSSGVRNENRVQEVSHISRGLKHLARDLDVPVIACAQLSRAAETRANNMPMLSDLRESGSIEQDADVVMFIYREDRYITREQWEKEHASDGKHKEYPAGVTQVIVAKHRNGPTGNIHLKFRDTIARFEDLPYSRVDDDWTEE